MQKRNIKNLMFKYSILVKYKDNTSSSIAQVSESEESIPLGNFLPPFDEVPEAKEKVFKYFHHHMKMHGEVISIDVVLNSSKEIKNFSKNNIKVESSYSQSQKVLDESEEEGE